MEGLIELDRSLTLALNGLSTPWSDSFWLFMSQIKVWYIMYALVLVLMFLKLGWKKALVMTFATILCIIATDQLCNLVKDTVCRLRPSNDPDMMAAGLRALQAPSTRHIHGFYSAHAANAFAFAVCTLGAFRYAGWKYCRIYGSVILFWAFLVALSRVFCGKHFIGDITVGMIVGILFSMFFVWAGIKISEKYIKQ